MLYFCTTRRHDYVIKGHLNTLDRKSRLGIQSLSYSSLFTRRRIPAVPFVFADLERLDDRDLMQLVPYWESLDAAGLKPLNHPTRYLKRYELLRKLYRLGINSFNIYRLDDDLSSVRYPVFVREVNEHRGSATDLIHDTAALQRELERLQGRFEPSALAVIEYLDCRASDGLFYKYSTFRVSDHLIPHSVYASRIWQVKTENVVTPEVHKIEKEFLASQDHPSQLLEIFELAGLQYGRIDFAIVDGDIQVFELNSAPSLLPRPPESRRYELRKKINNLVSDALLELGSDQSGGKSLTVPVPALWQEFALYVIARLCGPGHAIETAKVHLLMEDPTFFRRLFKRRVGLTSTAYRKKFTRVAAMAVNSAV